MVKKRIQQKNKKFSAAKWTPFSVGDLKHKLNGRKSMYIKYRGEFTVDDIRDFAQTKSDALVLSDTVQYISVGVVYSTEGDRSGKMTKPGDPVDVRDLQASYTFNLGDIVGFIIYIC